VAGVPVLHDQGRSPRRLCGGNYIVPPPCLNLVTRDSTRCDCSTSRYIISLLCMTEIHKYLPNPWWFGIVWNACGQDRDTQLFQVQQTNFALWNRRPFLVPRIRFPAPITAECGRSDSEVGCLDEVLSFSFTLGSQSSSSGTHADLCRQSNSRQLLNVGYPPAHLYTCRVRLTFVVYSE
jgi:hypothetical protein